MRFRTDESVLKECDELGEIAVEARLAEGYFSDNPMPAREWLMKRRRESEQRREQQSVKHTLYAVYASWILVVITFLGIWWQKEDALEQRKIAKEQLEQQQKDNNAQRNDAKALLEVQISIELDKQFDSPEMRQARKRLSIQLLNNKNVTETRAIDFFDKLGMYTHQGRIDQDTVYRSYSYWIERYWPAIKTHIEKFRQQENDPDYYGDFEDLYKEMLATDAEGSDKSAEPSMPSKKEIQRFLKEEATLSQ